MVFTPWCGYLSDTKVLQTHIIWCFESLKSLIANRVCGILSQRTDWFGSISRTALMFNPRAKLCFLNNRHASTCNDQDCSMIGKWISFALFYDVVVTYTWTCKHIPWENGMVESYLAWTLSHFLQPEWPSCQ